MEPIFRKSTHDLAMLIASNVSAANLPEDVEKYFLDKKEDVIPALRRGFVLPEQKSIATQVTVVSAPTEIVSSPTLFKATDSDLGWWIDKAEEFYVKHLGLSVDLRKMFVLPEELPWQSVIPVFDHGTLTNRDMVDKVLKGRGLAVWEEEDVMKYSGSQALKKPTLHLIENSVTPNEDTMGKSPNGLRRTKKLYLRLRGYGFAMALYHFAKTEYLDPKTFTWFPEDRLHDGYVAGGYWDSRSEEVEFRWGNPDNGDPYGGGRVAIPVPLRVS